MKHRLFRLLPALLLLGCSVSAASLNWPIPKPPAGTNPAIFAQPRNDWMVKFNTNLQRAQKGKVDLLFIGDSISSGWGGTGAKVFKQYYGKRNAATFGISGDRTENILWRLQNGELDGISPRLIVIMAGTNNIARDSAARIAEGVEAIVNESLQRCPQAHVLLLAVFPRSSSAEAPYRKKLAAVNLLLEPLGNNPRVTYLDIGSNFINPDGSLNRKLMPDNLHPNAAGYALWAEAIEPVVARIVDAK